MSKKLYILTLAVVFLLSAAACGSETTIIESQVAGPSQGNNQQASGFDGGSGENQNRQPGFNTADLSGEVVSVSGNKIELKVIEMPSFNRGGGNTSGGAFGGRPGGVNTSGSAFGGRRGNGGNTSGGAIGERRGNGGNTSGGAIGGRPGNGGNTSGGAFGGRRGNGGNTSGGAIGGQPPQMTLNYTGETKTVEIPDGVEITATTRGDNGMEQKKLELSELKQGDILQIRYADDGSQTISQVSVFSGW